MTLSPAIDKAIVQARAAGNAVEEISSGWSAMREVVHMKRPLTPGLRAALTADAGLRYFKTERTPHDRAEQGFIDESAGVAITFPVR